MALTKSQEQALTRLRQGGGSELGVQLDDARLSYVLAIMARDLELIDELPELKPEIPGLYDNVPSDALSLPGVPFRATYEKVLARCPDADTYLLCLGKLLKARLKYEKILRAQPIPTVEQVGPRSLLQFGHMRVDALTAFLFWRKWIYDIDNRAGQETGYLFEPIVAQAIGGTPFGSKKSPVRRNGTGKRRQVDCIRELADNRRFAYELKLRVTIAASGQGRWGEELQFPQDCLASGYVPVLVVFDETPNPKLEQLVRAFKAADGLAYVGSAAWAHLEDEAGPTMSTFLERYVRGPLDEVIANAPTELPPISMQMVGGDLVVEVGGDRLVITRTTAEDPAALELAEESEEESGVLPDDVDDETVA